MHPLTISPVVAHEVIQRGEIEPEEFRRNVRHWFPAGWSICNELKRRHTSFPARLHIEVSVGKKAVREVRKLMSAEAMRTCVEAAFGLRFTLESEDVIVAYEPSDTPTRNLRRIKSAKALEAAEAKAAEWRKAYPKGYAQIERAVDQLGAKNAFAIDDSEISDEIRKEVELLMAIESARSAIESIFRVRFVFLLPCRICMARDGYEDRILKYTRPVEQIETISIHPSTD
ncbi:hypothetical protein IT407_03455 [Candidatus Uhrbacteria bacterium]|nr:hypothetical protein [Candidatus Uhrbacteria bacterium]